VLNAVGNEGVPVREIAEAIGRHLNLPARSLSPGPLPAGEFGGMLVHILSTDMPASSTITQELLCWNPNHPGLIEDIRTGSLLHLTSPGQQARQRPGPTSAAPTSATPRSQ